MKAKTLYGLLLCIVVAFCTNDVAGQPLGFNIKSPEPKSTPKSNKKTITTPPAATVPTVSATIPNTDTQIVKVPVASTQPTTSAALPAPFIIKGLADTQVLAEKVNSADTAMAVHATTTAAKDTSLIFNNFIPQVVPAAKATTSPTLAVKDTLSIAKTSIAPQPLSAIVTMPQAVATHRIVTATTIRIPDIPSLPAANTLLPTTAIPAKEIAASNARPQTQTPQQTILARQPTTSQPIATPTKKSVSMLLQEELQKHTNANIDTIKHYLNKGADIRTTATDGYTVLHAAAVANDYDLVEKCLSKKVKANAIWLTATNATTPLYWAMKYNSGDVAQLIIDNYGSLGVANGIVTQRYDSGNFYTGTIKNGDRNGNGSMYYADGEKYDGNWLNGEMSGFGIFYYAEGTVYEGNWKNDKMNGQGIIHLSNGDRYEGNWENGVLQGKGTFVWDNGNKYEGSFLNGKLSGQGTFYWIKGDKYVGGFENGKMSGKGIKYCTNGDVLEGVWANDSLCGLATCTSAKGDKYVGYFHNDMLNGKGTAYFRSGDKYEGEWKNSLFHGYGTFTWKNGTTYKGQFENNLMHGKGEYIWNTCERYVGDFAYDMKSGTGTMYFTTDDVYTGEWSNDMENGQGTFLWQNGDKYTGEFKDHRISGWGTCIWQNGDKYEGNYLNSNRHGKGTYTWYNGDKYIGDFENNMRWGEEGTYYWTYGDMYTGQWVHDRKNGCGTLYWVDGSRYTGDFDNDRRQGYGTYIITTVGTIKNCPRSVKYIGQWINGLKHGTGKCYDANGNLIYDGSFENDKPTGVYPFRQPM